MKVKDFIEYLNLFNPKADIYGNVSGTPFDIDLNKHIAWCRPDDDTEIKPSESKSKCGEVFIDFTYSELAKL